MTLAAKLESLLFVAVKPLSAKDLAALSQAKASEVEAALAELGESYRSRQSGLALIDSNGRYQITTAAENADLVRGFLQDETSGELSQPSLEALTIIAYRGPIAKYELERIRGVNCSLIIRNLLLRGLIEEKSGREGQDSLYSVTPDFLRFLGLSRALDLPDYERLSRHESLESFLASAEADKA